MTALRNFLTGKGDLAAVLAARAALNKAVSATPIENPDGRAIGLSRLMIDASFLGLGSEAATALKLIDLKGVSHEGILNRVLDFGSSVALNTMSGDEFASLKSQSLKSMDDGWARVDQKQSYEALYNNFNVGIFTILQQTSH